jgi:uncharacterized protein YraI
MTLRLVLAGATALVAGLSAPAAASVDALASANIHMRAGPGMQHEALAVVPAGAGVTVYACTPGFAWCDARWQQARGWVSGRFLQHVDRGVAMPQVGETADVPIITFGSVGPARHGARLPQERTVTFAQAPPARHSAPITPLPPLEAPTLPDPEITEPGILDHTVGEPEVVRRDVIRHATPIHEERMRDDAAIFGIVVPLGPLP